MGHSPYRYVSCHPMTREQLAPSLRFTNPKWTETVNASGTFSGTLSLPQDPTAAAKIKVATEPNEAAIYVSGSQGGYPWGGVVVDQQWDSSARTIEVVAVEWRSWLFGTLLAPKTDLSADNVYGWTNVDQLIIARQLLEAFLAGGATDGVPTIQTGNELSGKNRDLNISGIQLRSPGAHIDSMANRDGGFEWTLVPVPHVVDGLPVLQLGLYYPERGNQVAGLMFHRRQASASGNIVTVSRIRTSSQSILHRVWATGSGQPPDQPYAQDSDPALAGGRILRWDASQNFDVVSRSVLASHARGIRKAASSKLSLVQFDVPFARVDPETYAAGDRARFRYQDDMYDIDVPSARIVQRTLDAAAAKATVVMDITDLYPAYVDTGGAV